MGRVDRARRFGEHPEMASRRRSQPSWRPSRASRPSLAHALRRRRRALALAAAFGAVTVVVLGVLGACSSGFLDFPPFDAGFDGASPPPPASGDDAGGGDASAATPAEAGVSATIGALGGTLSGPGGVRVDVPAGAVDANQNFGISVAAVTAPSGALTPIMHFEPAGTVFAHPVTVSFPLPDGTTSASVYWTPAGGHGGFDPIGGDIASGRIVAEVVHFSDGYVGPFSPTRAVTGSRVITRTTSSGVTNLVQDQSSRLVRVYVATDSGYTELGGTGYPDGTFRVPDVPLGPYLLRVDTAMYAMSASAVDYGEAKNGRTRLVNLPDGGATSTFTTSVTGLAPFQAGSDTIDAFSVEADDWWFDLEQVATGVPAGGATALSGFRWTASDQVQSANPNRVEGSKGDHFTMGQLVNASMDGGTYRSLARVFDTTKIDEVFGGDTVVNGAFSNVSGAHTLSADFRISEFEAQPSEYGPNTTQDSASPGIQILGQPNGLDNGFYGQAARFLLASFNGQTTSIVTDAMPFATPGSERWGVYVAFADDYLRYVSLAGTVNQVGVCCGGVRQTYALASVPTPVKQELSPPLSATLDGITALTGRTGVSTTPVVAWAAPRVGAPQLYDVEVVHLYSESTAAGLKTRQKPVLTLRTNGTSVRIPTGILTAGERYILRIAAVTDGATTFDGAPLRSALPHVEAACLTAVFQC
jgi:hypothetical protein